MGFLSAFGDVKRITLDKERGYWVDLKEHVSQGDRETAQRSLESVVVVDGKTNISPDVTTWREQMVLATIAGWNLDDDNGIWPITLDSVKRLPGTVFDMLWVEVEKLGEIRKGTAQQEFRDGTVGGDQDGDAGSSGAR
jgi:hypothetical protein